MKKYLITYDLSVDSISTEVEVLYKTIKSIGTYMQIMNNAFIVQSDKTAEELSEDLFKLNREAQVLKYFFVSEITDNRDGCLFLQAWQFIWDNSHK